MEVIIKGNPNSGYFDDTERIDDLKCEVYYDREKPIKGFAAHRKVRSKVGKKKKKR